MPSNELIAQRRKEIGLTQENLAEHIGVSRQTIAMWETARQFPTDHVALLTARFLNLKEEELMAQLRWDRLHQRVDQLEKQYNAVITIKPAKEKSQMKAFQDKMTQTIDGVMLTITRIYKSVYWDEAHEPSSLKIFDQGFRLPLGHTDERLFLHVLCENQNDKLDLLGAKYYVEDNLGNRSQQNFACRVDNTEADISRFFMVIRAKYVPEATSFTFHHDFVNRNESDCDAVSFENVSIDGKGITKAYDGETIRYDGICWAEDEAQNAIHLVHDKPREVRHVGITKIVDNLGNTYIPDGRGHSPKYHKDIGGYSETCPLKEFHPDAASISFKYLLGRTILSFELRDLPLPS